MSKSSEVDMKATLTEFKELASQYGGQFEVEHRTSLDPDDEDDTDLIQLFAEAGLPFQPKFILLLLRGFAAQHCRSGPGRRQELTESDDYDLIESAYATARKQALETGKVSLRSVSEDMARRGMARRAPADYRDPQGNLAPKTIMNRLSKAISNWEAVQGLPSTQRNFHYAQERFRQLASMVAHLRRLKAPPVVS